jgi:intein/homing endonuclease
MKPLYRIDEKYFEDIDNEDKSYFLGIIFADGYLNEKRNYMSLSLQYNDIDILEKLKNSIDTDKPLQLIERKEQNTKNQYRLLITRKKIVNDLKKLGVNQNKSLTANPSNLDKINHDLLRHFLRGYYDGDGSITFYKTRNTFNSTINICCTIQFFNFFSDFIYNSLKIKCLLSKRHKDEKNMFDLRICGNRKVKKFLDFLYKDSSIYLKRKWEKYDEFNKKTTTLNKSLGDTVLINVKSQLEDLYFESFKSASNYFKIPLTTFKRKLRSDSNYLGYNWIIERS